MSRDVFKPRKIRPPLLEDQEPLVRDFEATIADDAPIVREVARRAARRAEHRRSPNETSIMQEIADVAAMAHLGDSGEILRRVEDEPLINPITGPIAAALTARYNPAALGGAFTDAFTLGNAAEIAALATPRHRTSLRAAHGTEEDDAPIVDYDQALAEAEAANAREYARNPGSAATGFVGGMAAQAPLLAASRLAALPGASRFVNAVRAVAPVTAVTTAAGAGGGALAAEPGHRIEGAARGGARGLATGVVAGALGAGGNAIRAAEPTSRILRALAVPAAGMATGAEFGVLGTSGAHPDASAEDYVHEAERGAALGGVLEPVVHGISGLARIAGSRARPTPPLPETAPEVDEVAMLTGETPTTRVAAGDEPILMPSQVVDRVRAGEDRSALGDALLAPFEADPAYDRLSSLSANGPGARAAARQGAAAFGSVRGHVDELQRMGLAREGAVYSREAENARVLATRDALARELARNHARIGASGETTSAAEIADRLNAEADALADRSPILDDPETSRAVSELRARARGLLTDVPAQPDIVPEPIEDIGSELPGFDTADVEYLGRDQRIPYEDVRAQMELAGQQMQSGVTANRATGSQTPSQRIAPLTYRALAPARDEIAQAALGDEYAAHRAQQRAFQATNAVFPVSMRLDPNAAAQPADLRGALARMGAMSSSASQGGGAADQMASGMFAQLRERLLANYQHSLRAAFNERGIPAIRGAAERLQLAPDTVARIASATGGEAIPALAAGGATTGAGMAGNVSQFRDAEASDALRAAEESGQYDESDEDLDRSFTGVPRVVQPTTPEEEAEAAADEELDRRFTQVRRTP